MTKFDRFIIAVIGIMLCYIIVQVDRISKMKQIVNTDKLYSENASICVTTSALNAEFIIKYSSSIVIRDCVFYVGKNEKIIDLGKGEKK